MKSVLAAALAAAVALVGAPASAAPLPPYAEVSFLEVPNAVAVADTGLMAVSLFDQKSVALVSPEGTVQTAEIDCGPVGVAINSEGTKAWAVCRDSAYLYIVDTATATVGIAGFGEVGAEGIAYRPSADEILLATPTSQSIVVIGDIKADNYLIEGKIPTPGLGVWTLALAPGGNTAYGVTISNKVVRLDLSTQTVTALGGADMAAWSVAVSADGTTLYCGAWIGGDNGYPAIRSIDPATGATRQEVRLNFSIPGSSAINVAAGYRVLYAAAGLGINVNGTDTGLLALPLDSLGRMGPVGTFTSTAGYGSAVGLSTDRSRLSVSLTSGIAMAMVTGDTPYPASLSLRAKTAKGSVTLTGRAVSIPVGTRVTVLVKDLTAKRPRFVAQAKTAVVGANGRFSWSARMPSKRFEAYVSAAGVRSSTVRP